MKKELRARVNELELAILDISTSLRHVARQLTDRCEHAADEGEREQLDALGCTVMVLHRAAGNVAGEFTEILKAR